MSQRRLQLVLDLDTGRYSGRLRGAGAEMRRFNGEVSQASHSVDRFARSNARMGSSLATPTQKLREYVLLLGNLRFAAMAASTVSGLLVGSFLKQSAEIERLTMLMTGLSNATTEFGKNQEAKNNIKSLYDMSRQSGFAVKELSDAFVKFKAGGLDPTNGSLQSLVDATARFGGTSETMHRASIAIQQMSGKGVISMEELRQQLGEAVPTAIADMARAMNKGVGELVKEISDGKVKAGPALQALFEEWERMYAGSAKRMSQTMNGQMAQLRTNIMEMSTTFTGLDEGGGLFSTAVNGLKQLNESMRSGEARAFIREIGQGMNTIVTGMIGGVQHIIRWRNEYGTLIQIILTGMAMIMARNLGSWMIAQFGQAGTVWANLRTQVSGLSIAYGQMTGQLTNLSNARVRELVHAQREVAMTQQQRTQVQGFIAASQQKVTALNAERTATLSNITMLERRAQGQQRLLNIARAEAIQGNQSAAHANRRARLERELATTTTQLGAARQRLIVVDGQLVAAERTVAVAQAAGVTATNAATAATARHTAATTIMATVARIGAGALAFLRAGFSMLLGPIGMVIMILVTLCSQLGVFTSRAQAATNAAAQLRQGLVDLAAVRAVEGQMKANSSAISANERAIKDGYEWVDGGAKVGKYKRYLSKQEIAARQSQNKSLAEKNSGFAGALVAGHRANVNNRKGEWTSFWQGQIEDIEGNAAKEYSNAVGRAKERYGEGTKQFQNAVNQARARQKSQVETGKARVMKGVDGVLNQKGITGTELRARSNAVADFKKNMEGAGDAAAGAAPNIAAAGDAAKGSGSKAGGAADKLGNMAENLAVAQARAAGTGEALAKFNQQVKNGEMSKWSAAQIERGRALAMATDALKDNAKAAGGARQANESFDTMLANTSGKIAELSAELNGGEGELARFNAEVAAGKYQGVTEDRIEQMRRYLTAVEQLNREADHKRGIDRLNTDLAKAQVESKGMWDSWMKGSLEADGRLNQVRERYGDVIEAAERAAEAGNPEALREVNDLLIDIAANRSRADAVDVMNDWKQQTEEIMIGLQSEEEQRRLNYERELSRQISLIDWTRLSAEQRMEAEKRLNDYKAAAEARMARESESAITKQARQWAQLGQNIDQALAGALSNFVDGLDDAEFNFVDFAKSMMKELVKIILKAMVAYAILSALGMANNASGQPVSFGDFMKGQIGAGFGMRTDPNSQIGFGVGGAPAPRYDTRIPAPGPNGSVIIGPGGPISESGAVGYAHTGGLVGALSQWGTGVPASAFSNARKYHKGGYIGNRSLRPGEVPLIGMEGELMLTERHQELLGKRLASGSGAPPAVQVNVINNSGTQLEAEQGEPDFNGKEFVVNVIVEAAQKEGPLRDVLGQVGKQG